MWCILLVFFCTCCMWDSSTRGGQILCQMQVCLWEEIHNTWKDLTAKSCSYVCFPFEEPETKDTAFFHFCTQCSTLVCIHSFVNLWLMTNLNPWHMCWETFQGFFLRVGPWNPTRLKGPFSSEEEKKPGIHSWCQLWLHTYYIQKVQNHELSKKLIDSQKFENSPRLVCAIFFLVFLTAATISGELPKIQKQHLLLCQPSLRQHEMMWPRWLSTVYALVWAIHYHWQGCFLSVCNSWNLLNTWRWYILGCWEIVESQHFKGTSLSHSVGYFQIFVGSCPWHLGDLPRVNFPVEFRAPRWRWRLGAWRGGGVSGLNGSIDGTSQQQKLGSVDMR